MGGNTAAGCKTDGNTGEKIPVVAGAYAFIT